MATHLMPNLCMQTRSGGLCPPTRAGDASRFSFCPRKRSEELRRNDSNLHSGSNPSFRGNPLALALIVIRGVYPSVLNVAQHAGQVFA